MKSNGANGFSKFLLMALEDQRRQISHDADHVPTASASTANMPILLFLLREGGMRRAEKKPKTTRGVTECNA